MTQDIAGAVSLSGRQLAAMLDCAAHWLRRNARALDALNVFPVPDGDTGSNMSATLNAAALAAASAPDDVGAVMRSAAEGALLGARGNSGVILSQMLFGFATAVSSAVALDAPLLAAALEAASQAALQSVSEPKQGTMLTVIADVASSARRIARPGGEIVELIDRAVIAAKESVERSPSLLPLLREAGVVDSGGLGIATILEGFRFYARGEPIPVAAEWPSDRVRPSSDTVAAEGEGTRFGYCTEFVIEGQDLSTEELRAALNRLGTSVLVVGTPGLVRVHLHTEDPGAAVSLGVRQGALSRVKIDNMDQQHAAIGATSKSAEPAGACVVAVVAGDGFTRIFNEYGGLTVSGVRPHSPSAAEMLSSIERSACNTVFLLPNDPNLRAAAEEAAQMAGRSVHVVPATTPVQGIAALLAFNRERTTDENLAAMRAAASTVHTVEIVRASGDTAPSDLPVPRVQSVAFLDGITVSAGSTDDAPLIAALRRVDEFEAVTLFFGADVDQGEAALLGERIRSLWPAADVEVVRGGQPLSRYLVSID